MKVFDYAGNVFAEIKHLSAERAASDALFLLCRPQEVPDLQTAFGLDEGTVLDCNDLDESVRFTSFDGYDFLSLVYVEPKESAALLQEINVYISKRYVILVMPPHESQRLSALEQAVLGVAQAMTVGERQGRIGRLYFAILHALVADFGDMLEGLEDRIEALSECVALKLDEHCFTRINDLRRITYTVKKQMRAFSYIGGQILMDENELIDRRQVRYFRNIDTRMKRLNDFAESVYTLSNELLYTYDSKLTMRTNDIVNKLTMLTLIVGPLTVITGIYGMNFDVMPELRTPWGYPIVLAVMALISFSIYRFFKRKKWL